MELYTKRNSPDVRYIAAGFSEDSQMGDDAVTYCVLNADGQVEAHLSVNPPADKTNIPVPPDSEQGTLELLEGTANDEGIYCKVRQHSNPSAQKNLVKPNLQRPYHMLLAKGAASEPRVLSIHSLDPTKPDEFPFTSAEPLQILLAKREEPPQQANTNFAATGGGTASNLDLVDVHGMLMVIAWIGMSIMAIYSARYMRNAWPHTTVMGLKIWFHIHRTLNFLAVLLMLVSIVCIVWNKQRWTGPWFGKDKIGLGGWHSLAGALSVLFALSQPFGALLRCGVDHPKRPIFNWIHRSIGLFALVAAQCAMFIALYRFKKHFALADFALWLLIFVYAALVVIIVLSEMLRLMEMREQRKMNAIEMQTRSRGGTTPSDAYYYHSQKNFNSKLVSLRKTLFAVTGCVCAGTAIILLLLILFH